MSRSDRARVSGIEVACALALWLVPSHTLAQSPERLAARRVLLDDAQDAARAGEHGRALDLGNRAAAIQSTPSLRWFLATENQALGRYVAALGLADSCARDAALEPPSENRTRVLESCRQLVTELRGSLAYLTVHVPATGFVHVSINGTELTAELRGVSTPVDPGPAVVEAETASGQRMQRGLTLVAGQREEISLDEHADAAVERQAAPPAPPAIVDVRGAPAGAAITIDGRLVGVGATTAEIGPGDHRVVIRAEGHQAFEQTFSLPPGARWTLEARLEPVARPTENRRAPWVIPVAVGATVAGLGAVGAVIAGSSLAGRTTAPWMPSGGTWLGNTQEPVR